MGVKLHPGLGVNWCGGPIRCPESAALHCVLTLSLCSDFLKKKDQTEMLDLSAHLVFRD